MTANVPQKKVGFIFLVNDTRTLSFMYNWSLQNEIGSHISMMYPEIVSFAFQNAGGQSQNITVTL